MQERKCIFRMALSACRDDHYSKIYNLCSWEKSRKNSGLPGFDPSILVRHSNKLSYM